MKRKCFKLRFTLLYLHIKQIYPMKLVLVYYLVSILTKIKHPLTFNSLINKYIRTYREKIATTISLSPKKVINPVLKRVLSRIYIFHFFFFFFLSHSERRRGSPTRSPMLEIYSRSPGVSRVYKCMGSKWPN